MITYIQSWTEALGIVMQYSLSIISGCPQKTVENALQFVLSPLYTKLNIRKILNTRLQPCLWGGGGVGHV